MGDKVKKKLAEIAEKVVLGPPTPSELPRKHPTA
jgi:hypothetical protein